MYCRLTNLYCCFLGVITAADNIKYPAINAFVRAFKQDQGGSHPHQGSLDDTELRNNHTGKPPTLESKTQRILMFSFINLNLLNFYLVDLQRRCVKTATSIFQSADRRIAIPFVQAMAPLIIQVSFDSNVG